MLVLRDIDVAGFDDHVNSLAYCARPFTIELLNTYQPDKLRFLRSTTKLELHGVYVTILRFEAYVEST
jgi:hypothetical protein